MRVTSAHVAPPRPISGSQLSADLSISDVYRMAESTRVRMSQESRQLVLTRTQKLVRNDSGMSRPVSGFSSVSFSRRGWGNPGLTLHRHREITEGGGGGRVELKTRAFSANDAVSSPSNSGTGHYSGHPQQKSRQGSSRLGSALTVASTGADSELMSCVSPRPFDSEARKMSVSRQCCEVMGPGVCRDCQKLRARLKDRERMEADFPRLRVSEKNVTTSAVLKRFLPDMTQAEIQDKIARGEIDRGGLQFPPRRSVPSGNDSGDDDDDDDADDDGGDFKLRLHGLSGQQEENTDNDDDDDDDESNDNDSLKRTSSSSSANKKKDSQPPSRSWSRTPNTMLILANLKMRMIGEASTPLFYMHLRHMNSKIFQGRVNRTVKKSHIGGREEEEEKEEGVEEDEEGRKVYVMNRRHKQLLTVHHPPASVQAFVSPRKAKPMEEPAYKVFFEPPLLAKHKQESTPSFFAGSDNEYRLPDRLPDVIEFADGKTSLIDPAHVRSESSMSLVSGVSDEGVLDGGSSFKVGLQETVQE